MQMTRLIGKLGRNDARLIRRDSFLIFMFFFVIAIAIGLRLALPAINNYLAEQGILPSEAIPYSLTDFYPMFITYMILYTASGVMVGTIFGFMLLDEKDDNTIKAIMVTPVSLNQYVLYRVGLPAVLAFFISLGVTLFVDQALLPLWQMIPIALGSALLAPIISLFYGIFASNKVEGFAYSKFVSLAGWIIVLAWFVQEPIQYIFGLFPPYWISKAYWLAFEGNGLWWVALMTGIIFQVGVIWVMIRRFNTVIHK
ncbi:hypothetical protein G4Y79_10535 [Phototrophicus methaneseepsis]|uniref:Uncharacterized protein n=1 Tax=Phototrophicus methaneseepsis TaxID=2710758 RepID=A0A7S8EDD8_9CHLR|nr:hypothetical protein [Phototrophicus methaneseepsis]QPC84784.1 hypothetical protein G4Y79_10535 [Phototrophicus methaneseepsis]